MDLQIGEEFAQPGDKVLAAHDHDCGGELRSRHESCGHEHLRSESRMLTKTEFETALDEWFGQAQTQCSAYVDVTAVDLHRHVGGYPLPRAGMSICCDVMREAWQDGDEILAGSIRANHGSLTIRYRLPR